MEPTTRLRPLLGLLTLEVAAVVTLHRLGRVDGLAVPRDDVATWARLATTEELVGAGLRVVGLVVAWWLLATTFAYLIAVAARRDRFAAAVRVLTLPAIRRRVDRALAVTALAGASILTPAAALADEPPPTAPPTTGATVPVIELDRRPPRDDAPPVPEVRGGRAVDQPPPPPSAPTTTAPPAPAPIPQTVPAEPVVPTPTAPPSPTTANHVVEPGESLWTIAATHLSAFGTDAPSEQDIAGYWRTLVDANRSTLRSGNPNLIYPGEVVALPASMRTS